MTIMKLILNKYIIIILSFYAFWILGLPFIFAKVLPEVCENISINSEYTVEIDKPQLYLSPLPTAKIKAKSISVKAKKADDYTRVENFESSIRLLPLLSGRLHINTIKASDITADSVLKKELELDKNFFRDLNKMKIRLNELDIASLSVNIRQSNLKDPVKYSAKDIYFKRTSRALRFNLASEVRVKDSASEANINLYLPHNNDVTKSIVDVTFDNFDIAPLTKMFFLSVQRNKGEPSIFKTIQPLRRIPHLLT